MARSSTYCTWMLPLLLLLFISVLQSSSVNRCGTHTLEIELKDLEKNVKHCSDNCSSPHITDKKCKCLNLTVSQEKCAFPKYFTEGLKSLHPNISNQEAIKKLIRTLTLMDGKCEGQIDFCELNVTYEPVLSPRSFHSKLAGLAQQVKSILSSKVQQPLL